MKKDEVLYIDTLKKIIFWKLLSVNALLHFIWILMGTGYQLPPFGWRLESKSLKRRLTSRLGLLNTPAAPLLRGKTPPQRVS